MISYSIFAKSSLVVLIVLLLLAVPAPAHACTATPPGQEPPTIARRVESADVVLLGTVTEVLNEPSFESSTVVQVAQYFKGAGSDHVEIIGFGESSTCRRTVAVGDRFIFYVQQYADGSFHAHWLTAGDAVAFPTTELIKEIEAAVSPPTPTAATLPPPVIDVTPTGRVDDSATGTSGNWVPWGMAVFVVVILATAVLAYRRYQQQRQTD